MFYNNHKSSNFGHHLKLQKIYVEITGISGHIISIFNQFHNYYASFLLNETKNWYLFPEIDNYYQTKNAHLISKALIFIMIYA